MLLLMLLTTKVLSMCMYWAPPLIRTTSFVAPFQLQYESGLLNASFITGFMVSKVNGLDLIIIITLQYPTLTL